jgi:hypothetical protein
MGKAGTASESAAAIHSELQGLVIGGSKVKLHPFYQHRHRALSSVPSDRLPIRALKPA